MTALEQARSSSSSSLEGSLKTRVARLDAGTVDFVFNRTQDISADEFIAREMMDGEDGAASEEALLCEYMIERGRAHDEWQGGLDLIDI